MFRRKSDPSQPRRRDIRSVIGTRERALIIAAINTADGIVSRPRDEGAIAGGYLKALVGPTPKKPELRAIALRHDKEDTFISIEVRTRNGDVAREVTSTRSLTRENAHATAVEIAKLLKLPGAAGTCERELVTLLSQPPGTQRAFSVGSGNRLSITTGD